MDLAKREPRPSTRLGDPAALARLVRSVDGQRPADQNKTVRKRHMVAELCRLMGSQLGDEPPPPPPGADLTGLRPRLRQTLERLLAGDSEKQIAIRLGLSRHTVHVYVKGLYRHFQVNSRGELLSKFVNRRM